MLGVGPMCIHVFASEQKPVIGSHHDDAPQDRLLSGFLHDAGTVLLLTRRFSLLQ